MVEVIAAIFIWSIITAIHDNDWRPLIIFIAICAIISFIGSFC